jgi:hypothetical protein
VFNAENPLRTWCISLIRHNSNSGAGSSVIRTLSATYCSRSRPRWKWLLGVVLREIDDLKRAGRNDTVREGARRAERRLKGIRNHGDVRQGVCVAGDVVAKFEHIEPRSDDLPDWLDMTVPDDRLVASALLLQSEHPGSALYVATSDINLQTKLHAVGLPYIEPPTAGMIPR